MSKAIRAARLSAAMVAFVAGAAIAATPAQSAYQLARDRGCMVCHGVESSPPGTVEVPPSAPSFEDIARRYRADPSAVDRLAAIVEQGSGPRARDRHWAGKTSFTQMFPNELEVTNEEAREIVGWILTLAPSAATPSKGRQQSSPR